MEKDTGRPSSGNGGDSGKVLPSVVRWLLGRPGLFTLVPHLGPLRIPC
jgi:hypothetical protein